MCEGCRIRSTDPELTKPAPCGSYQNYYLGTVNEPIRAVNRSRMAFGPWFLERVKEFGISPENLTKARAAWSVAMAGLKDVPPLPDMGDGVITAVPEKSSWTPEKKKKAPAKPRAKKEETVVVPPPVVQEPKPAKKKPSKITIKDKPPTQTDVLGFEPQLSTVDPPLVVAPPPQPEVKVKRVYKKKTVAAVAPPQPQPIAILSEEKPVDVEDVETIDVILKHIDGTDYYYDSRNHKNKLYNPKTGKYVGRLESDTGKIITTIPDSDAE